MPAPPDDPIMASSSLPRTKALAVLVEEGLAALSLRGQQCGAGELAEHDVGNAQRDRGVAGIYAHRVSAALGVLLHPSARWRRTASAGSRG